MHIFTRIFNLLLLNFLILKLDEKYFFCYFRRRNHPKILELKCQRYFFRQTVIKSDLRECHASLYCSWHFCHFPSPSRDTSCTLQKSLFLSLCSNTNKSLRPLGHGGSEILAKGICSVEITSSRLVIYSTHTHYNKLP